MRTPRLFTILLATVAFLSLLAPAAQAAPDIKDVLKQIEPAVGIVWVNDQKGQVFAHGSGFFLTADGEFITNRHVLEGAYSATIEMANGNKYRVTRVLASHPELDMVKVKVETRDEQVPFLKTAAGLPEKGDRVLAYGNPKEFTFVVTEGIVSAIQQIQAMGGDTWIQFTAPVSQGNSGGPLINMNAEVVGIVTWGRTSGQNLNFALPIYELRNLLDYAAGPDYAPPGSDLPLIPAAGAVQKAKPAKPVVLSCLFAPNWFWNQKSSVELLAQKVFAKLSPEKYDVRGYQDARSDILKYLDGHIDPRKDLDMTTVPHQVLTDFGRKTGLDYIHAVNISAQFTGEEPGERQARVRMVVKLLDVATGKYIYYDVLEGYGRYYAIFTSGTTKYEKAFAKAFEEIMAKFEKEVKMP